MLKNNFGHGILPLAGASITFLLHSLFCRHFIREVLRLYFCIKLNNFGALRLLLLFRLLFTVPRWLNSIVVKVRSPRNVNKAGNILKEMDEVVNYLPDLDTLCRLCLSSEVHFHIFEAHLSNRIIMLSGLDVSSQTKNLFSFWNFIFWNNFNNYFTISASKHRCPAKTHMQGLPLPAWEVVLLPDDC